MKLGDEDQRKERSAQGRIEGMQGGTGGKLNEPLEFWILYARNKYCGAEDHVNDELRAMRHEELGIPQGLGCVRSLSYVAKESLEFLKKGS